MTAATWYVLEDGNAADPRDVRPGGDGKLRHKDGRGVAYAPHGPRSRMVDPDAERAAAKAARKAPPPPADPDMVEGDDEPPAPVPVGREMKPARQVRRYKTRSH